MADTRLDDSKAGWGFWPFCSGILAALLITVLWDHFTVFPAPEVMICTGVLLSLASAVALRWLLTASAEGTAPIAGNPIEPNQSSTESVAEIGLSPLLDASGLGFCQTNAEGCLVHCNQTARQLLGHNSASAWKEDRLDFHFDPAWWKQFQQDLNTHETIANRTTDLVTKTGGKLHVELSARRLGSAESPKGYLLTVRNLGGPSSVPDEVRTTHERYQALINNLNDVVFEADREGRWTFLNPAWASLTGIPPSTSLGQAFANSVHPDQRDEVVSLLKGLRDRRQDFFYKDLRWVHSSQTSDSWVACFAEVCLDTQGEVVGITGTLMNITERKELELSLRNARHQAECANRAKDDFLAVISHEIRTPMNAVLGLTCLLLETPLNPEQRDFTTIIHDSGQTLLTLINDILDFTRFESGQLLLKSVEFEPAQGLSRSINLLRSRASEKNLTLETSWDSEACGIIRSDPSRFQQIVLNLVGNAIKFTEQGGITVRAYRIAQPASDPANPGIVSFTPAPPASEGDWLCVTVSDTGIGISPEHHTSLFKKFTQVDSSTTRRFGGVGMGLAISKSLLELLGGRIGVSSEASKGSTFWFAIPAKRVVSALSGQPVQPPSDSGRIPVNRRQGKGRVLVAEDNPTNATLIERLLQKRGLTAELVPDGRQAVQRACSEHFDLVLMDCDMPNMDGITATAAIRKREQETGAARVPVVALTANVMHGDREKCTASGMDGFLSKPLDIAALDATLSEWLGKVGTSDSSGRSY